MLHAAPRQRIRVPSIALVVIVLLGALGIVAADPASSADVSPSEESEFVSHLNAQRSAAGLPALVVDGELTAASRSWAHSMAAAGAISHANPISAGITSNWQSLGENVGVGPSVGAVMDAFMNSSGHRANILNPDFTHVGVGVVRQGATLYTTHRFMKLFDTPAPPPPPPPPTTVPVPVPTVPPVAAPPTAAPAPLALPSPSAVPETTPPTPTTAAPAAPVAAQPENDKPAKPIAPTADRESVDDLVAALVAVSSGH